MANAGMFNRGNHYLIDLAVENLQPGAVLEIGSFCGFSTNVIRKSLDHNQRDNALWTCDPWNYGSGPMADSQISYETYETFVRDSFIRAVQTFSTSLPHAMHMTSAQLMEHWRRGDLIADVFGREAKCGGPLSLCYIDGEHDYENVKQDFERCDEFLVSGGFLLFDDSSGDGHFDVNRFLRQMLRSTKHYEIVDRNPNYLIRRT
jgi:methyltransferase family protein